MIILKTFAKLFFILLKRFSGGNQDVGDMDEVDTLCLTLQF
jgi:hypothetical protein